MQSNNYNIIQNQEGSGKKDKTYHSSHAKHFQEEKYKTYHPGHIKHFQEKKHKPKISISEYTLLIKNQYLLLQHIAKYNINQKYPKNHIHYSTKNININEIQKEIQKEKEMRRRRGYYIHIPEMYLHDYTDYKYIIPENLRGMLDIEINREEITGNYFMLDFVQNKEKIKEWMNSKKGDEILDEMFDKKFSTLKVFTWLVHHDLLTVNHLNKWWDKLEIYIDENIGHIWIDNNLDWLGTHNGIKWLESNIKEYTTLEEWAKYDFKPEWLNTEKGYNWINKNPDWLKTSNGKRWINDLPEWLDLPEGQYWINNHLEWLDSKYGEIWMLYSKWIDSLSGHKWINKNKWLLNKNKNRLLKNLPKWLQTQEGDQWIVEFLNTYDGETWISGDSIMNRHYIGYEFQEANLSGWIFTESGKRWLKTKSGYKWLDSLPLWLYTKEGNEIMTNDIEWINTFPKWIDNIPYNINNNKLSGHTWINNNLSWLNTDPGKIWLDNIPKWLQTTQGISWVKTTGQKWFEEFLKKNDTINTPHFDLILSFLQ